MRFIHIILMFTIMLSATKLARGQASLDSLLAIVEKNSPGLVAAEKLLNAEQLEASTGLVPDNPEVEFAYLWGAPEETGNRVDFSITQSVDFPTAYISRSKLSKISQKQAELEYEAKRQEYVRLARETWVTRVHLNRVRALLTERKEFAEKLLEDLARKLETGEANRLQMNQARMKVIALDNRLNMLEQEFSENESDILTLTGGISIEIGDQALPLSEQIIYDSLVQAYHEGCMNQAYQTEIEKKAGEVDVVSDLKLPKLKAGYYRETILNTKLEGLVAGITIPLWGNARAVKTARANLAFAETDADRYWQSQRNEVRKKYEQWGNLKERTRQLAELLVDANDELLLRAAMENGEISLTEYYYESDHYFQSLILLEEFRRDLLLLETDLQKVYY